MCIITNHVHYVMKINQAFPIFLVHVAGYLSILINLQVDSAHLNVISGNLCGQGHTLVPTTPKYLTTNCIRVPAHGLSKVQMGFKVSSCTYLHLIK